MKTLVEKIKGDRFLIIGRAGMDMFAHPPGVKVEEAETFHCSVGGSAANIAVGLAKLGARASLVTCVSDDAVGRFCLNTLGRFGVDCRYIRSVGGEARNQIAVYDSRIEEHSTVIYRNGAADFEMSSEDIDRVDYAGFHVLITAGTVLASEPARSATFRAFERARAAGIKIIFDIDYRPYSWVSPEDASETLTRAGEFADVVVGNDEEFGFMAGGVERGLAKARSLADAGADLVVYKMGGEGAISFAEGRELRTGVYPVAALKPNGAGDSFMAGLMSGLFDGLDLRASLMRGSACAAIVVARPGCAPAMPDRAGLDAFLANHPGPTEPAADTA